MRPTRLELSGFTAFREQTVIRFDGTDSFALVGPTGSGKSSILDAMIFALYGSVPRYQNANLVAPAVSQGRMEARVRLDFSLDGKDYTAVRVVRRTQTGATTREARLEHGGDVLAGNVDELTKRVEELTGLTFEQFTSCVVLPQGEFARFLNDKPSDRQDLLVKLLGLGIYDRIRAEASARAAAARSRRTLHSEELTSLSHVTAEAEDKARKELSLVQQIQSAYQRDATRISELEDKRDQARATAESIEKDIESLGRLSVPKAVNRLAGDRARLQAAHTEREAAAKRHHAAELSHEKKSAALGNPQPLVEMQQRHMQLRDARELLKETQRTSAREESKVIEAEKACKKAQAKLTKAQSVRDRREREDLADTLRGGLVVGEPCVVCGQRVRQLPRRESGRGLEGTTDAAIDRADDELERETTNLQGARRRRDQAVGAETTLEKRIAALQKELKSSPPLKDITRDLEAIEAAQEERKRLRGLARDADAATRRAHAEVQSLASLEQGGWRQFDEARDELAHLKPPARRDGDLSSSWRSFVEWGQARMAPLRESQDRAKRASLTHEMARCELVEAHERALRQLGFQLSKTSTFADQIAQFLADGRSALKEVVTKRKRKAELETLKLRADEETKTADALAVHLAANRFERWLLEAAFERLVEGASQVLRRLSSGAYSFKYNKRLEFEVVDHANADETRSARTLSGGETFLASLALALTLADQVADLATKGAARLESMFLDEGFGSLDPQTLETVAGAIEELGSQGRMIGIVTHDPELAGKTMVQYQVAKGPNTSTVERVIF